MKIVHLPSYDINPYQQNLANAQANLGHDVQLGGGGGNFLRTALFEWKPDIMHFHWLHPYLLKPSGIASVFRSIRFIIEVLLLKITGARIVWTIHNLQNHANQHVGIERFFTMLFCRLCKVCIAHTHEAARLAESRFRMSKGSVKVIPHPSYVGLYRDDISRHEARQRLNIRSSDKVFLFIGRINEYKGVFDLFEAFTSFEEDVVLLVAGVPENDEMRQKLEAFAATNNRILLHLERVSDDDFQVYFRASDVAIFPYKQILTSGAMILAMSFGVFIIAPDVSAIKETIGLDGGLFYKINDTNELRQSMRSALELDYLSAGEHNYQQACEWNQDAIAQATIQAVSGDPSST